MVFNSHQTIMNWESANDEWYFIIIYPMKHIPYLFIEIGVRWLFHVIFTLFNHLNHLNPVQLTGVRVKLAWALSWNMMENTGNLPHIKEYH